jgi:hypothetical protein
VEGTGGEATDFIWEEGYMSNWNVRHKTLFRVTLLEVLQDRQMIPNGLLDIKAILIPTPEFCASI